MIALVLGSLLALALTRFDFFGKRVINLLVILPIALPGIVTGVALQSMIQNVLQPVFGINAGLVHDHRRPRDLLHRGGLQQRQCAAAPDGRLARGGLGRPRRAPDADARLMTFPLLRSSLVAGAVLAFGLSFDEIVVTTFTAGPGTPTLPIWIFNNLFRPNQAPVVNVVAVVLVVVSILPVWAAQRLGSDSAGGRI